MEDVKRKEGERLVAYIDRILVENRGKYDAHVRSLEEPRVWDGPFQELKGKEDFERAFGSVLSFLPDYDL